MKSIGWIVLVVAVVAFGVYRNAARPLPAPQGDPSDPAYAVKASDEKMRAAMDEAKRRWPEFLAAYTKRSANDGFGVKFAAPVRGQDTSEHLWLAVASMDSGKVTGVMINIPHYDIGYKKGDTVTIGENEIEDWIVQKADGTSVGGFTNKVLEEMYKTKGGNP